MIRAIYFPDHLAEAFERHRTPGSFMLRTLGPAGLFDFRYFCPCGCGMPGELRIGENFKPGGDRPSWRWNGSKTEPTLDPSVNLVDHWHGWLRDGYWVVAA
jgi:hypothetical protein